MNCVEFETPLGRMLAAEDDERLAGLWFVGQRHFPVEASGWPRLRTIGLGKVESQVQAYLAGRRHNFDLPLTRKGTAFEHSVWRQLTTIPYAQRRSYGQIARALGRPDTARAVGRAVGANPWSLIVPCHRVVGSDGRLTGYAGGLDRKCWLLAMEQSTVQRAMD